MQLFTSFRLDNVRVSSSCSGGERSEKWEKIGEAPSFKRRNLPIPGGHIEGKGNFTSKVKRELKMELQDAKRAELL